MLGNRFGVHRVIEPKGALPQAAWRLDNRIVAGPEGWEDEVVIDVERLNIDSASFRQMEEDAVGKGEDAAAGVAARIAETVRARGKQHNPVTGSGGMLVGRVAWVGPRAECGRGVLVGDRVATLVSLTLTPLALDEIGRVDVRTHQVEARGRAALFSSGALARLPGWLDERVALAALDVAGAAPQVARLVRPGAAVLILGCGGKSGLLASAAARRAGAEVVVGVERSDEAAAGARRLGACHHVVIADAADAVAVAGAAVASAGREVDVAVSCVNVADAEMSAILAVRDGGTIYFFSMATSFTKAALGAEGVSRDVSMLIGNGYAPNHAEHTLELLREDATLRAIFEERFAGG